MTQAPSHLSPSTPNFHIFWDSTMLGTLKECAYKFYLQHILHRQSPGSNLHLHFGQLFHKGGEVYDHARARGEDHQTGLRTMVHWGLEATGSREDGVFQPWDHGDPKQNHKTRFTLIRSLVWTMEDENESPLETYILANGKPAVELSFRFGAFEVGGEPITFCGHLDKLVKFESQVWVKDRKTTKSALDMNFFHQFTPNNQMSLYACAGRVILNKPVAGVLIGGVQLGVNFSRSRHGLVPRSAAVLDEWLRDAQQWIELAHHYAVTNHWPMNDKSCNNYGGCPFRKVCAVSPAHRPSWLASDFVEFHWNPLEIRGDI